MEETTTSTTVSSTPAPRPTVQRPRPASARTNPATGRKPSSVDVHAYAPWALVAAVVILALAVLGVISVPGQKSEAWQAVFLTNGQAYFGHIARVTPNWLTLRDVYYLQTQAVETKAGRESNITLMKLGKELHGPEDEMRINREHVLFIEKLRDDSEVAATIARAVSATGGSASGGSAPPPAVDVTPSGGSAPPPAADVAPAVPEADADGAPGSNP